MDDQRPPCFWCGKRQKKDEGFVIISVGDGTLSCHPGVCAESCAEAVRVKQEDLL